MAPRGEREVRVKFTGEDKGLSNVTGRIGKEFQGLVSDTDDARGAGEKLAEAYTNIAEEVGRDMAAVSRSAAVMRDSLGPEMVQALESGGRSIEDQVQDWRKLGLTYDDIIRDSDKLAAGLKQLDDAARQSTGNVGDGMKKVADNSDRARSNMANFAGNMASELPLISGALGPLNVGIGQMAEGLAEGAVNWKQMLSAGLAMGLAAVVLQGLTDDTNELAKAQREAMRAKLVETWADALYEARGAVSGLTGEFEKTGKVIGLVDTAAGRMGVDFTSMFADAGLTAADWTEALAGGAEGAVDFETKLRATSLTTAQQDTILRSLVTMQELYVESADRATDRTKVMGDTIEDTGDKAERADGKFRNVAETIAETGDEARETDEDLRGLRDAMDRIDKSDAVLNLEDQFVDLQTAAEEAWVSAATGADDAEEKAKDYQRALNDTKREVIDYAEEVDGIPDKAVTDVLAQIDNGSITTVEQALDKLEEARTTTLTVIAKQGGSTTAWNAIGSGLGGVGKNNEDEPTRTNSASPARGGDSYNTVKVDVTVTPPPGISAIELGQQISDQAALAIEAALVRVQRGRR